MDLDRQLGIPFPIGHIPALVSRSERAYDLPPFGLVGSSVIEAPSYDPEVQGRDDAVSENKFEVAQRSYR